MPKDAYWFPHDSNARNDEDMLALRRKHDWAGVGIYWSVIEMLREADGYKIKRQRIGDIAYNDRFEPGVINDMIDIGLLASNDKYFWSESLLRRMSRMDKIRAKRVDAGRMGGKAKAEKRVKKQDVSSKSQASAKQSSSKALANSTYDSTGQESKEDKTRDLALTAPTPKKTPKKKKEKYPPRYSVPVWLAYKRGYMARYGIEPKRNTKQNTLCCQLRERLGEDDAAGVAEYYPSTQNGYYVSRGHSLACLLADAEKVCTEWKTGNQITQAGARETDRLKKTGDGWEKAIEEVCNGESK